MRADLEAEHDHNHQDHDEGSDGALVRADDARVGWLAGLGVKAIRFYQNAISPALPPSCRYQPTCSQYTLTAIKKYGFIRGSWMGLRRILRCHPFHPGGHDPVP